MGDSKKRKVPQKQKASNNSKRKSSSDLKENAPKREKKTIKPDPDDGIAMSKQLLLKKSNARTQRRTTSKPERICPNGKPIPSLSELEKMFEDSDDDDDQTPIQKPKRTPSTPEKPTNIIDKELILPTTIHKITERLLGSIQNQNLPSPDELLEAAALLRNKSPSPTSIILPPKKRKVPEVPYIVGCKDRPQVIYKPSTNFCKGGDDYGVEASAQDPEDEIPTNRAKKSKITKYTKSIFNAQSDEIAERLNKDDAGYLSDASTDSNKTIEYVPTPIQHPRPLSFSPLPSTSTDKKTFEKNDDLFNESFKETNTSKDSTPKNADDDINDKLIAEIMEDDLTPAQQSTPIKKDDALIKEKSTLNINEDDVQIIEIPYDTIEIVDISDKTVGIQSTASRAVSNNDITIIEPTESEFVKPKDNSNISDKIHDDDDCMIITSSGTNNNHNKANNVSESTIVIDDEYSTVNMEFGSFNDEPIEIIDVDDIIAENNTILHKWKNSQDLNNINTVIDVPNTYKNVSTPQTTVTPSTEVQTTSPPTTEVQTTSPPTIEVQTTSPPTTEVQTTLPPTIEVQTTSPPTTEVQTTLPPTIEVQTTSPPTTEVQTTSPPTAASTTPQAEITPSATLPTPSTSTPNYNLNMTNRNSATNTHNNHRNPPVIDTQRSARFQRILDDFFTSLQGKPRYITSIFESGNRISALLTMMVNRLESQNPSRPTSIQTSRPTNNQPSRSTSNEALRPTSNQTSRPTSNQTPRPTSNQTSRPTSNQTPRATSNQIPRPTSNQPSRPTSNQTPRPTSNQTPRPTSNQTPGSTSNQTPRPTSNTNRTNSHPVNTAMADTTSVFQNSISTLQNADSSQRDLGLNDPSSNSSSSSPIPTRNIGDCPICLDPLNTSNGIASTICGHVFCLSCIQASVKTNGKKCPTCRKALKGANGFHLLYL